MNTHPFFATSASMAWPVFLVSLDTAGPRRARSLARLDALGLRPVVFDAVRGDDLSDAETARLYDPNVNAAKFKRPLSRPEIGCYASHYRIWQRVAYSGRPAVVLEDDFEASDDLPEVLSRLISLDLPNAVIKLNCSPRAHAALGMLTADYQLIDPMIAPPFTVGYVITPGAAAALVERALPFGRPVDMDLKHWWEFGIKVLAVKPDPVWVRPSHDEESAISGSRASEKPSLLKRFSENLRYQAKFLTGLGGARLKMFWPTKPARHVAQPGE